MRAARCEERGVPVLEFFHGKGFSGALEITSQTLNHVVLSVAAGGGVSAEP